MGRRQGRIQAPPARTVFRMGAGAAATALFFLVPVQLMVRPPMLLAERYVTGAGWVEVALLAGLAAWMARALSDPQRVAVLRLKLWLLFSVVFFSQLLLGLAGLHRMLMTGKLHWPIPGLVVAGPFYHGRLFMVLLFVATTLVVGPAWCSHLCYLGAWDLMAARRRRRPRSTQDLHWLRYLVAGLAVAGALVARAMGPGWAFWMAVAMGISALVLILFVSPRVGTMSQCVWFCPLGQFAVLVGKLSVFRLRLDPDRCTECGLCTRVCRYGALEPDHIHAGRVGSACTLCGDCVASCPHGALDYRFVFSSKRSARNVFLAVVSGVYAVFLGLARI